MIGLLRGTSLERVKDKKRERNTLKYNITKKKGSCDENNIIGNDISLSGEEKIDDN